MDNITQGVIGWSLYTLITKKHTNKNFLLGSVIANAADFDVIVGQIIPFKSSLDAFFFHRGIMHSIVFAVVLSLVLGFVLRRFDRSVSYRRYVFACLVSMIFGHLLIDGMTSYGMRYRLPRSNTSYSSNNIFVIDAWMLIIVVSWLIAYLRTKRKKYKKSVAQWIVVGAGAYFLMTGVFQAQAQNVFVRAGASNTTGKTVVEPLQPLLWKHIERIENGYQVGYYSILDKQQSIDWIVYLEKASDREEMWNIIQDNDLTDDWSKINNFAQWYIRVIKEWDGYHLQNMTAWRIIWRDPTHTSVWSLGFELVNDPDHGREFVPSLRMSGWIDKEMWKALWKRVWWIA